MAEVGLGVIDDSNFAAKVCIMSMGSCSILAVKFCKKSVLGFLTG